ncbi:ATP-binding protein [Sphingomonas sp. RB56-2]|uniref:Oxygen sensor histidine kinase NreB n=1 Tax=Sphingomonas brevis TaxID=2908206 RepID=A0ABT0SAX9_9SPHN|nr:ATP-binding protein [Sphingomonas brevis]MCL6741307.1 ATP-binding protein [Sphingomonas brevis]
MKFDAELVDIAAADSPANEPAMEQLLNIHEYERRRMGQELHDSAGQLLVSLQLSVARLRLMEQNSGHDGLIDEIQGIVLQIDREIRALAFLHHPAELSGRGLCEAVQSLVNGFGKRTGIRTSFRCLGERSAVADPISTTLLRVAQEALVNIHRHSRASSAKVVLARDVDRLHLTVSDDGIGIASAVKSSREQGIGLQGMRHRVEMHGGRFNVRSLKQGTRISVVVPLVAA